ncbi:cation transport protein-domain-containing protein [Podospora didyma]|uniref:Potassium transport protein n=1 Tax=Podospora didyma TaxID=330526 RepID=A0AAE0KFM9_9PEZI|nr:cation transport protein-domain-containing protein [Podospora didyma]
MDKLRNMLLGQLKALRPFFISKKPHFNFISAHYIWIVSLCLTGSVVIYSAGIDGSGTSNLAYIDALVFASGASTQAGLNTVNLNRLNTGQQVVIYLIAMMANPITISSFVVFLRLYWFEKRFQHIVREARLRRTTLSKSRSKSMADVTDAEKGVNGRNITVMHNGARSRIANDGALLDSIGSRGQDKDGSALEGDDGGPLENATSRPESQQPKIKFANMVMRSDGVGEDSIKLPPARSDEEHIAILERQRKRDDEVLRIPGPRDADRGILPKRVDREDNEDLELRSPLKPNSTTAVDGPARSQAPDFRQQAITIEEPDRGKLEETLTDELADNARAVAGVFSAFKPKTWGKKKHGDENGLQSSPSKSKRASISALKTAFSRDKAEGTPYLSWEPTIGRNSQFPDLTEEQREELGGIEYRSLKTLALVLICYFWGFSLLGIACLLPWILDIDRWGQVVEEAGQSKTWWGFFTPNSAFMDLGYTLTPDSMNSFNQAVFPLLVMCFLIIIGNTGFPIMLRFIIWILSHIVPLGTGLYEELRFLLDHPRRCFTLLFPSNATWWLFGVLVILNAVDVIFFIILDLGSVALEDIPTAGLKVLNGFFEAASTRTAGFSCVNLAQLHPGVQVSYMIMMYISVFPIAISVRRTNVYEEKSLGIYGSHDEDEEQTNSGFSYVGAHLRRQLSFDLWYIFVGLFILAIAEGSKIQGPRVEDDKFSMFAVLFEIVSAYGTVGMSLGYPDGDESLCSQFSVVGKLVIIAMMIRGRHRGLPYGLDRAILLPSESLNSKEAADADARMARQMSHMSGATGVTDGRGASFRRARSISGDSRSNILMSMMQPGPPRYLEPPSMMLPRRSTERGPGTEDPMPYAARTTSRRTDASGSSMRARGGATDGTEN